MSHKMSYDEHQDLLGVNAVLLPIFSKQKGPMFGGWGKLTFAETNTPNWRSKIESHRNTGVLLGENSENLASIDIDSDLLVEVFLENNPSLEGTLITKGARGCNLWLVIDGKYPSSFDFTDNHGEAAGEWRANGRQTVIQGIHPDGSEYTIKNKARPMRVTWDSIVWDGFQHKGAQIAQISQTLKTSQIFSNPSDLPNQSDPLNQSNSTAELESLPTNTIIARIREGEQAELRLKENKPLAALYKRFIEEKFTAKQGMRNVQLIAMTTFLFSTVSEGATRSLVMVFYDIHRAEFDDSRIQHERELEAHLRAIKASWWTSFNETEMEIIKELPDVYQEACRILRALSEISDDRSERGLCFMSQSELSKRLLESPKKAQTILKLLQKLRVIRIVTVGQQYSKLAPRGSATEFEWLYSLSAISSEEGTNHEA